MIEENSEKLNSKRLKLINEWMNCAVCGKLIGFAYQGDGTFAANPDGSIHKCYGTCPRCKSINTYLSPGFAYASCNICNYTGESLEFCVGMKK